MDPSGDHKDNKDITQSMATNTDTSDQSVVTDGLESVVKAVRQLDLSSGNTAVTDKLWSQLFGDINGQQMASFVLNRELLDTDDHTVGVKLERIGDYSVKEVDGQRWYIGGEFKPKYMHLPVKPLDLLHGYRSDNGLTVGFVVNICNTLKWISNNRRPPLLDIQFVSSRTLFADLMAFPYETRYPLVVLAVRYNGVIYLKHFYGPQEVLSDAQQLFSNKTLFSGYRFGHYMTSDDAVKARDVMDIDFKLNNENFHVIRAQLSGQSADHSLLYSSRVDCIDRSVTVGPDSTGLENTIALASTISVTKFKKLKWWIRTQLAGTPNIYCGHRNDQFMVNGVERIGAEELPKDVFWSPKVCLNFLDKFLTHAKQVVTDDDPRVVYRFKLEPNRPITCTRVATKPDDVFNVLPEWYIK